MCSEPAPCVCQQGFLSLGTPWGVACALGFGKTPAASYGAELPLTRGTQRIAMPPPLRASEGRRATRRVN